MLKGWAIESRNFKKALVEEHREAVLVVARGGSAEGLYQSPWMDRTALNSLIESLGCCLDQDGRHHFGSFQAQIGRRWFTTTTM